MNMMKTLKEFVERKYDERKQSEAEVRQLTPEHKRQVRLRNAILTLGYTLAVASLVAMPAMGVIALTAGIAIVLPTVYAGMERHHEAVRISRQITSVKENIALIDREIGQAEQDLAQPKKTQTMGEILVPLSARKDLAAKRAQEKAAELSAKQQEKQHAREVDAMMANLVARKRRHRDKRPGFYEPSPATS